MFWLVVVFQKNEDGMKEMVFDFGSNTMAVRCSITFLEMSFLIVGENLIILTQSNVSRWRGL